MTDLANLIGSIVETHRERVDFMNMENSTILRMRAICRRFVSRPGMELAEVKKRADELYDAIETGDHPDALTIAAYLMHHLATRDQFHKVKLNAENRLKKLALQLPVWTFVQSVHGFGALGLAQIVAESGDLGNYANPGKLWKRFGMAPHQGRLPSAWRRAGGLTAEDWTEIGYSPTRRSMMHVIGDSLIKKQNFYRDLYLLRKAQELAKAPDATKMVHHRRALVYVEKRLLKNLWRAWRNEAPDELAQAA